MHIVLWTCTVRICRVKVLQLIGIWVYFYYGHYDTKLNKLSGIAVCLTNRLIKTAYGLLTKKDLSTETHTDILEWILKEISFSLVGTLPMPLETEGKRRWNSILIGVVWQKQASGEIQRKKNLDCMLGRGTWGVGGICKHSILIWLLFKQYVHK